MYNTICKCNNLSRLTSNSKQKKYIHDKETAHLHVVYIRIEHHE